jgi:hypothetical protein
MTRPPPLPRACAIFSLSPLASLLTREDARALPSPALADTPAPLARVFPLSGRPTPPVSRVIFPAYDAPSSLHRRPLHHRPLAAQEEFGTAPSSPLTNVLAGTAPPWSLIGGVVRH